MFILFLLHSFEFTLPLIWDYVYDYYVACVNICSTVV